MTITMTKTKPASAPTPKAKAWPEEILLSLRRLEGIRRDLEDRFCERGEVARALVLAAVCHEHLLLLGPPGTGKSELLSAFAAELDTTCFQYMLTRFTEPSELFGPVDMKAFEQGEHRVQTAGMLPTASLAFLDEVFQGSSAILNTLLSLVHERVFHNGRGLEPVPLITLVSASNELSEDPALRAFADRFLLRLRLEPVAPQALPALLDRGWQLELDRMETERRRRSKKGTRAQAAMSEQALRDLHDCLDRVQLGEVRRAYEQLIEQLRAEGTELSDRRIVKGLKLVAGAALLRGDDQAAAQDLWPLQHAWARENEAPVLARLVAAHVGAAGGPPRPSRPAEDLRSDVELLASRVAQLDSMAAISSHLMALQRLRNETRQQHPQARELLATIEGLQASIMGRLEGHV